MHQILCLICTSVFAFATVQTPGTVRAQEATKTQQTIESNSESSAAATSKVPSGNSKTSPKESIDADSKIKPGRDWTMFRGDTLGTGFSKSKLPEKLELLWTFKVPKGAFESTAAIVDGVVYISDLDGKVYAFGFEERQKGNGSSKSTVGFSASPSVRNGLLFVGDYDGTFYCLDLEGKLKWKHVTEAEINSSANFFKDNVLFGSQDATLYCLDMKTGELTWKYQIEDQIRCSPTVVENRCFVAGCDARLHIVDLDKGKGLTAVDIDGPTMVTPAVVGNSTYFGTEQGTAFSINWKEAKKKLGRENRRAGRFDSQFTCDYRDRERQSDDFRYTQQACLRRQLEERSSDLGIQDQIDG